MGTGRLDVTQYMVEPVSTHVKPAKGQKYYLYVQNINKLKYLLVYVKIGSAMSQETARFIRN